MSGYAESSVGMVRWLPVKNTGEQDVPGFGLCVPDEAPELDEETEGNPEVLLGVSRPDTDSQFVYVNSPVAVAKDGFGAVTGDDPIWALYDEGDGEPAAGETWGAGVDSYKLRKDETGFKVIGGTAGETGNKRVLVRRTSATEAVTDGYGVCAVPFVANVCKIGNKFFVDRGTLSVLTPGGDCPETEQEEVDACPPCAFDCSSWISQHELDPETDFTLQVTFHDCTGALACLNGITLPLTWDDMGAAGGSDGFIFGDGTLTPIPAGCGVDCELQFYIPCGSGWNAVFWTFDLCTSPTDECVGGGGAGTSDFLCDADNPEIFAVFHEEEVSSGACEGIMRYTITRAS